MIELDKGAQDCINTILRNRGIAEVKVERNSVVVVDISRKVKYKSEEGENERSNPLPIDAISPTADRRFIDYGTIITC